MKQAISPSQASQEALPQRIESLQDQAPCYFYLPDDGAKYYCNECGVETHHSRMIRPFCPDGKPRMAICLDCVCQDWLSKAKEISLP